MNDETVEALVLQLTDTINGFDAETATAALTVIFNVSQRIAVGKGLWREWIRARDAGYRIFEAYHLPRIEERERNR